MSQISDVFKEQLNSILESEESRECLQYFMNEFSEKSVDNAIAVLDEANLSLTNTVARQYKEILALRFALQLMIGDHKPNDWSKKERNTHTAEIATILTVCAIYFPEGLTGRESEAENAYFEEAMSILRKRPAAFDYKGQQLYSWAAQVGIRSWIQRMVQSHVDPSIEFGRKGNL